MTDEFPPVWPSSLHMTASAPAVTTLDHLREIKSRHDPHNFFPRNHNFPPLA